MTIESTAKIEQINESNARADWTFWHFGAILSFFGGIGAIFIGSLLTVEDWLFRADFWNIPLQTVINGLFYSAFPLLFLGAYCLDKIDEKNKKYCHENQK